MLNEYRLSDYPNSNRIREFLLKIINLYSNFFKSRPKRRYALLSFVKYRPIIFKCPHLHVQRDALSLLLRSAAAASILWLCPDNRAIASHLLVRVLTTLLGVLDD